MLHLPFLTAILEVLCYAIRLSLLVLWYFFRICFYLVPRQVIPDPRNGHLNGLPGQYHGNGHLGPETFMIDIGREADDSDNSASSSPLLKSWLENKGTLKRKTPTLKASPTVQRAHNDPRAQDQDLRDLQNMFTYVLREPIPSPPGAERLGMARLALSALEKERSRRTCDADEASFAVIDHLAERTRLAYGPFLVDEWAREGDRSENEEGVEVEDGDEEGKEDEDEDVIE